MTKETLQEAISLSRTISDLEAHIKIVKSMQDSDNDLVLGADTVGSISIAGDDALKDDIIDIILSRLNNDKDNMEDALRLL